jgi:predicted dehydrogenase
MISVGLVGTSWWADIMYLPALKDHPLGRITALCGRNRERAQELADKWQIPNVYTDYHTLIDSELVDALIVATPNSSHYPITMKALEAGLHVLCEKPLGMNYREARQMAELADRQGVKHLVPFTWRFSPTSGYVKQLIDEGYIGKPYHLNLRYYSGYARSGEYAWRYDKEIAGSGIIGDLGSHVLYLAYWFFGEVTRVAGHLRQMIPREATRPDGSPYEQADDSAFILLEFANGAHGVVHATGAAKSSDASQSHLFDLHGSEGSLYSVNNFKTVQRVTGLRGDDTDIRELPIPDEIWSGASRDDGYATVTDVLYKQDVMARSFVSAITENKPVEPDFHDGAYVQRLVDAAIRSHQEGCWIEVESIQ